MDPFANSLRSNTFPPPGASPSPGRKNMPPKRPDASPAQSPVPSTHSSQKLRSDSIRSYQSDSAALDLENLAVSPSPPNVDRLDTTSLSAKIKKTNLSLDFQGKQNVKKPTIWEPPISCQRRILPISSYQTYFPIELTSRDYFNRLMTIVINIVQFLDMEKLQTLQHRPSRSAAEEGEEIPMKLEEFMNLVLANVSSKQIYDVTSKLHLLSKISNKKFYESMMKYITIILDVKDAIIASSITYFYYDNNGLQDDLNQLFDTVYALLILFQEFLSFNVVNRSALLPNQRVNIDTLIMEIKDLQNQWKLHKVYQQQRLSYLGWELLPLSASSMNLNTPNLAGGAYDPSIEESKETPSLNLNYDEVMDRCDSLRSQIEKILSNPKETAIIMLVIRIYTIIEDLTLLSNEIGEIGDYQEAFRLRQLLTTIDLSINSNYGNENDTDRRGGAAMGRNPQELISLSDNKTYIDFRKYLDYLYLLKNDLYKLSLELVQLFEKEKQLYEFNRMILVENAIHEVDDFYHQFLYMTRKASLINQPSVLQRMDGMGTSFINSNFLFLTEFEDERVSVASLLIQSESEYLLKAIETWPELTLLNRSSFNIEQAKALMDEANRKNNNMNNNNNPSNSDNNSMIASDWNYQQSRGGGGGGGYTSSLVLSNASQYKKEFSQLIYETLQSFEVLLQQLNSLLTNESIAHSELICRLIGIRDDLYSLIEVNTHATNQIEAERLLEMVSIIDNTIDADEQDSLYHHQYLNVTHLLSNSMLVSSGSSYPLLLENGGMDPNDFYGEGEQHPLVTTTQHEIGRGRKRIDNIYQFMKYIMDSMNELQKLKLRSKSINDFIAMKSIEKMINTLKTKIELLEKSIQPFHLLDHENDISSYGYQQNNNNNSTGGSNSPVRTANNQPRITGSVILDINERIAREGTEFLTADLIFTYCCGSKGHSIGSLAIVAGAGAILRYIKGYWPSFTVLNGSDASTSMKQANSTSQNRSMVLRGSAGPIVQDITAIDFRSANTLRLLGFDAKSLQLAGFSTIDILTAGYTADQLKSSGFAMELIRAIPYFDHYFMKAIGYHLETQAKILIELFYATNGSNWKRNDIWKDLDHFLTQLAKLAVPNITMSTSAAMIVPSKDNVNNLMNNSKAQQQVVLLNILKKLHGITVVEPVLDPNNTTASSSAVQQMQSSGGPRSMQNTSSSMAMVTSSMNSGHTVANLGSSNFATSSAMLGGSGGNASGLLMNSSGGGANQISLNSSEITKLNLSQNGLNGVLPNGLGSLVSLVDLTLSHNSLKGEIPASLGLLIQLEILALDHNQFEGEIPRTFKNLAQLTILRLEYNRLHGLVPTSLGNLSKLRRLDVSFNQLSGPLPQRFGQLAKIQELLLNNNQFTGEIPLSWTQLFQLTHLELQNNQLTGALPLGLNKLSKLTGLNLQNNKGILTDRLSLQKCLPKCRIKL